MLISIYLDDVLLDALEEFATEKGYTTRSATIRELLWRGMHNADFKTTQKKEIRK